MNPMLKMAALSRDQIEREALALVQEFCPELLREPGPFPMEEFLDTGLKPITGFEFYVSEELGAAVDGLTSPLDKELILSAATFDQLPTGGRALFTAAHEVGHVLLHADQVRERFANGLDTVLHRKANLKAYEDPEWQANTFAAALLMPLPAVQKLMRLGESIGDVANIFKVSHSAAQIRVEKLRAAGLI